MNDHQVCGACGKPIWFDRNRSHQWQEWDGQPWCRGKDGDLPFRSVQHAPAGTYPIRVRASDGQHCDCIDMEQRHVHSTTPLSPDHPAYQLNGPN